MVLSEPFNLTLLKVYLVNLQHENFQFSSFSLLIFVRLFGLWFNAPVNSYGHVETVFCLLMSRLVRALPVHKPQLGLLVNTPKYGSVSWKADVQWVEVQNFQNPDL